MLQLKNNANINANAKHRSTFSSFSTKWAKDSRFKAVEKSRDREAYFKDFVEELYKKEKEDKRKEREKVAKFLHISIFNQIPLGAIG